MCDTHCYIKKCVAQVSIRLIGYIRKEISKKYRKIKTSRHFPNQYNLSKGITNSAKPFSLFLFDSGIKSSAASNWSLRFQETSIYFRFRFIRTKEKKERGGEKINKS